MSFMPTDRVSHCAVDVRAALGMSRVPPAADAAAWFVNVFGGGGDDDNIALYLQI